MNSDSNNWTQKYDLPSRPCSIQTFPHEPANNTFISTIAMRQKYYMPQPWILYFQGEHCMLQGRVNSFTYRNKLLVTFQCLTTLQNIWISLCNHWRLFFCIYRWPQFHLRSWKEKKRDINIFQLTFNTLSLSYGHSEWSKSYHILTLLKLF